MGWRTTSDVAEFLAVAGEYLRRERARNNVLLTVSDQLLIKPARWSTPAAAQAVSGPLFGWWTDEAGAVDGAFLHTPPHPVLLTAVPPDVAKDLARALVGRPLTGANGYAAANGYAEAAEAFAATWCAAGRGRRFAVERRMRLYRLGDLIWPDPAPNGAARVATGADVPLAVDWFAAFADEAHGPGLRADPAEQEAAVLDKVSHGGFLLWEAAGRPVSLAGVTRPAAGMVRVAPVFTPPEFRGRGYASAVTAEASRRAREAGAEEVLLYTDLANPTSNSIYQRIGYRAVEDRVVLAFSAAELPAGNLAFPGRRGILEGIMLLAGKIFRYVAQCAVSAVSLPPAAKAAQRARTRLTAAIEHQRNESSWAGAPPPIWTGSRRRQAAT